MSFDYDLFVIGGGSGGVRAGRLAAAAGKRVALAEEYRMGGTCVIRGCVPKKLMVFASGYSDAVQDAQSYGWDAQIGAFNWQNFRGTLHAELDRLEQIYGRNLKAAGAELIEERATITGPNSVTLASGREITAELILVATGGVPFVPEFEGSEHVWTSNDVFLMDELPARVLIVGGGYIACEFACIFNGLGSETTQFYRGDQILRGFDGEARGHIADLIRGRGVNLQLGTDVARISKTSEGLLVETTGGQAHIFDAVIYATGRVANTAGLGLENANIETGRGGKIPVDDFSQTSARSIYAIGDVTDRVNLTPVAIREGIAFVETAIYGRPTKPDHDLIPSAVFTQPEYGTVGLTEEEAAENGPIEVYSATFNPMQNAFISKDERVMFKLIVDASSRKVTGAHIIAPGAGELIQMIGVAIKMGATKEDFDRTVAVHPTMSEEIVLMKEPTRKT